MLAHHTARLDQISAAADALRRELTLQLDEIVRVQLSQLELPRVAHIAASLIHAQHIADVLEGVSVGPCVVAYCAIDSVAELLPALHQALVNACVCPQHSDDPWPEQEPGATSP